MVVVEPGLLRVFRSGFNLRFEDPSLTWLQMLAATTLLMFAVYSFDRNRALALLLCLVVLVFGVFRFTLREYVFAAAA